MPTIGALQEIAYQCERPYVLDSAYTQHELGLAPTLWGEVCPRTGADAV